MRLLLTLWLILAITAVAHSEGNPDARFYIDFDPPNYVHSLSPPEQEHFRAYVCIDQLGDGIMSARFRLDDLSFYPEFADVSWTDLNGWSHPDGLAPWEYGSIHDDMRYAPDCVTSDQEPVVLGYVEYYYWGPGGGCVEILDSEGVVYTCGTVMPNVACILSHGSVSGDPCPPGDCPAAPVDDSTWGTIKALYR